MDTHMEKQPPINGHAWPPFPVSGEDVSQHGIPASGVAAVPVRPSSVTIPISSQGGATTEAAAGVAIGMAWAAPAKTGIW